MKGAALLPGSGGTDAGDHPSYSPRPRYHSCFVHLRSMRIWNGSGIFNKIGLGCPGSESCILKEPFYAVEKMYSSPEKMSGFLKGLF